jgi:hypothetical protein
MAANIFSGRTRAHSRRRLGRDSDRSSEHERATVVGDLFEHDGFLEISDRTRAVSGPIADPPLDHFSRRGVGLAAQSEMPALSSGTAECSLTVFARFSAEIQLRLPLPPHSRPRTGRTYGASDGPESIWAGTEQPFRESSGASLTSRRQRGLLPAQGSSNPLSEWASETRAGGGHAASVPSGSNYSVSPARKKRSGVAPRRDMTAGYRCLFPRRFARTGSSERVD